MDKEGVDFYVFLTYLQRFGEHKLSSFENKFLIVPTSELKNLVVSAEKKSGKRGIFSFCFNFAGRKVVEKRDKIVDCSEYQDAWNKVEKALH